jgi:MazG family protein
VARGINEKLVRRHPHVFGDASVRTAGRVRERWEEIKTEQEGREGVFHHLAEPLPALLLARKIQRRAASVGFEYPDLESRFGHLEAELRELRQEVERAGAPAPETAPDQAVMDEVGDVLFLLVNVAMRLNVDPELALRRSAHKFVHRVERAIELADDQGEDWRALDLQSQDAFYERAKAEIR